MRPLVCLVVLAAALLLAASAGAAKPGYSCAVTASYIAAGDYYVLHVTGTVPRTADPYLRTDGQADWTALHNQKGVIDDYTTRTSGELPPGTHTADLIDLRQSDLATGFVYVGATCTFQT